MRLENKIGIVTAAASGMGRAGAIRFAREGAAVGVVDIDQAGVDAVVGEIPPRALHGQIHNSAAPAHRRRHVHAVRVIEHPARSIGIAHVRRAAG